jgi:hypothetical protein
VDQTVEIGDVSLGIDEKSRVEENDTHDLSSMSTRSRRCESSSAQPGSGL